MERVIVGAHTRYRIATKSDGTTGPIQTPHGALPNSGVDMRTAHKTPTKPHAKAGARKAATKAPRVVARAEKEARTPAMGSKGRLKKYRAMRDFTRTPEPAGGAATTGAAARFVIQEHHASHLHWDFRLERNGVLVSWALPKGLPMNPKKNRLAVHVEDHPLPYIDFAGEIPAGNYGAGHVQIWDHGTYECHKFRADEVMVTLHGKRARGKYVLFQTNGKQWMIHRMDPPQDPDYAPLPQAVPPMLAKPGTLPRNDADYAYEIKWDGIRALVYVEGGRIRIESRNGRDITSQYPELRGLGEQLGARPALLDGEIVALDAEGRPSFQLLQGRMGVRGDYRVRSRGAQAPAVYMIFDVLHLDGHDWMVRDYLARRRELKRLKLSGPAWQTPAHHVGDGAAMLQASRDKRLEGIVAKRLDSTYEAGKRTGAWLKVKLQQRQELVIGGYVAGERHAIGALLLGYYDATPAQAKAAGRTPQFSYAGAVGTGFDAATLDMLLAKLSRCKRAANPFTTKPAKKGAIYVTPKFVAEIEFTEWTRAGTLRHPSFKGLREDKSAGEVIRETPDEW